MRRLIITLALVLVGVTASAPPAGAKPPMPTSGELVEQNRRFDGRLIVYEGEVVGDVMIRGRNAWINVNDDAYSKALPEHPDLLAGYNSGQAIWLPAAEARKVKIAGDYNHRGDIIRVVGVFHRACEEHGGDMDIHAKTLEVVKRGATIEHPLDAWRVQLAGALGIVAGLVVLWRYRPRRK